MTLLGRAAEQDAVSRLLASARLGRGGVLTISGEPGAGKTALLTDALEGAGDDVRVLDVTPAEVERDLPFAALHALLLPALSLLDEIPAPQAAQLGAALRLRDGVGHDRFAIGAAALSLVSRYAETGPVVVVLDDVQWADRPSVDALVFAARRVQEDHIAVLIAGRSGELPEPVQALPRLELEGLGREAAQALVATIRPAGPTRPIEDLYRATGGNPLALLELAAEPIESSPDVLGLPQTLPDRLQRAFARRLDALSPDERAVTLVAAMAAGDLRLTRGACRRLGLDPADLDGGERARLLMLDGDRVTFRHPLLRAVVYSDAEPDLRRRVHRCLADELAGVDVDRYVWHLAGATASLDEDVAALLVDLAARASARTAFTVASTAFERAARLSPSSSTARTRLLAAARAAWDGGLPDRALALLEEAEPPTGPVTAAGSELRATIAMRSGSLQGGLRLLEQAADLADVDERILLLADACHACMYLVDIAALRRVETRLGDAVPLATDPVARAVGLAAVGASGVLLGRDSTSQLRDAVGLLTQHVDLLAQPAALPWVLLAPMFLRDSDRGGELRALVDQVRARVGVGALPNLLFHVARDQATSNAWDRAFANYDEAARLASETGQGAELAVSLAGLAWLESRAGRALQCREHAGAAVTMCRDRSVHFGELWCELALGDLALSEGASEEASRRLLALTGRLAEMGVRDPDLHPGPELVDALLRIGRRTDAAEAASHFAALAEATGRPWSRARAGRALGLVAPDEKFEIRFESALEHHAHTRDFFETARTELAYGMRLRRVGQRVAARTQLRAALGTFDSLGAALWASTTRAELGATGETVPPREVTGPGALTPQELQVCLLLTEGRTTREAAAALFLSPKTIEYHLRKAYTKLGIHSRDELAAILAEMA